MNPDKLCMCNDCEQIVFFTRLYNHNCIKDSIKTIKVKKNLEKTNLKKIENKNYKMIELY